MSLFCYSIGGVKKEEIREGGRDRVLLILFGCLDLLCLKLRIFLVIGVINCFF